MSILELGDVGECVRLFSETRPYLVKVSLGVGGSFVELREFITGVVVAMGAVDKLPLLATASYRARLSVGDTRLLLS